jgi:ABC-type glycerol-3-phosphate transport system permease component
MKDLPMKYKTLVLTGKYAALSIISFITLTPLVWTLLSTLRYGVVQNRSFFPSLSELTLKNYIEIFQDGMVFIYIRNSLMYGGLSAALCVFIGLMAGFSLSRYKLPGKKIILTGFILIMMIPVLVLLVPLYFMFAKLNFLNRAALIIIYAAGNTPFCVWLNKTYIDSIPRELDEAAYLDGCTKLQTLKHIIFPLSLPASFSTLIIIFVNGWNELIFALIFLDRVQFRPITSGILGSLGRYVNEVYKMNSFAIIACVPILILFFVFQRYIMGGLTAGAVKE